jgi:hypothetical protein
VYPGSGRVWNHRWLTRYAEAWLSPLNRRQAFFHVAHEAWGKVSRRLVPGDVLSQAEIELVAGELTGCMTLTYGMRDLDLKAFEKKFPEWTEKEVKLDFAP